MNNDSFWKELDRYYEILKIEIRNQSKLVGSDIELVSKLGGSWFQIQLSNKLRDLLNKFSFIGLSDIDKSKYTLDDIDKLQVKTKFIKELLSVENVWDKRALALIHITNICEPEIKKRVNLILRLICIKPTLDEMLYKTESLMRSSNVKG